MEFEWDPQKAAGNIRKHQVFFEDAVLVFFDPGRAEWVDGREAYDEDRWVTIGFAESALLHVVYTLRGNDTFRLISARKANSHERKRYGSVQSRP